MVNPQEVTRLTEELQSLRGTVVRNGRLMSERVERVLKDARRLHEESIGTDYEPALASVENLLDCVKRGLEAKDQLTTRLRHAG